MKVAVPTQDGTSISQHFGRSKSFFVFKVEENKIVDRSVRESTFTAHAKGECHEDHDHNHSHGHGEIVEALKDCETVLCYGMGWRAAEALKEGGVKAFILRQEMSPEEAVGLALMRADSIRHANLLSTPPQHIQHPLLEINGDHTPLITDEPSHGDGKESHATAEIHHRHSRLHKVGKDHLRLV